MSFAITKFKAYGIRAEGAVRPHCQQVFSFTFTAANTDIAYDLGTSGGTFWTSAIADTTYGSLATAVRTLLLTRLPGMLPDSALVGIQGEPIKTYIQVAAGAVGSQYTLAISSSMPTITFVAGSAPTAWVLNLTWNLADGMEAIAADYGTTNS